jgi:hypothetical protein
MSYSRTDRYGEILALVLAVAGIAFGLFQQQQRQSTTWLYESRQAGLSVRYPAGWIVEEGRTSIVRMRDPKSRPYKTQYSITAIPTGSQSSARNILDSITLQRSKDLSAYRVLNIEPVTVNGNIMTEVEFAFVESDPNPFLQRLPVVVRGVDIVVLAGNRAIIVSFMSDSNTYERNRVRFDRFVESLRY